MKKTKIAFFAEILIKEFDGASRTMHQIIDRIPTDRFEFLFFCGVEPEEDIGHPISCLPAVPIPFNFQYKMVFPYFSEKEIQRQLDNFSPDIIHVSSPSPLGYFALEYAKDKEIPILTIYHTHFLSYIDYYLRQLPFLTPSIKSLVINKQIKFYDHCDVVLVPTQTIIDELRAYGFKTGHMALWERGIDTSLFSSSKRDRAYIKEIVQNDHYNILFASRLVWEKNLETLVKVYQLAKKTHKPYNFVIAGDGIASQSLQSQMPDAYFMGKLDHNELSRLYASSDVFVFPSHSETYGNVVIEAMASGLPCVVANKGGSSSFIKQGVNGYAVDTHDEYGYLKAIDRILTDHALRNVMKRQATEYTCHLDWGQLVKKYFSIISTLDEQAAHAQVA